MEIKFFSPPLSCDGINLAIHIDREIDSREMRIFISYDIGKG